MLPEIFVVILDGLGLWFWQNNLDMSMEKKIRKFGRVSEHGLLTSIHELDDLIAYEQMPSIVEVKPIFENEFAKSF